MMFRIIGSGMGTRIGYPSTPNFHSLQDLVFDALATSRPLEPSPRVAFTKEGITN